MSGAHADSERPRPAERDARERILRRTNDPTALNGGSARHWYARGESERLRTPRLRGKLVASLATFGVLFAGALLLAEML